MAKIHFIPRFILQRFKGDRSLLELDKLSNKTEPRSVHNAGQREDFWPEGIELGLMQRMDNAAGAVLNKHIFEKDVITLNSQQRRVLSEWFGLLLIRVPKHFDRIAAGRREIVSDPNGLLDFVKHRGAMTIYDAIKNPKNQGVLQTAKAFVSRDSLIWLWFISMYEHLVEQGDPTAIPPTNRFFLER